MSDSETEQMTVPEPRRSKQQDISNGGKWVRCFLRSAVGSAIFTFAFAFSFLYGVGINYSKDIDNAEAIFPAVQQALVVGLVAWLVVSIGSMWSHSYVILNPIEAVVHAAICAANQRSDDGRRGNWVFGLIKVLVVSSGLLVGTALTTLVVYLLGAMRIDYMQNYILEHGTDDPLDIHPDGNQLVRVLVAECLSIITIIVAAYYSRMITQPQGQRKGTMYNLYAKTMGFFYFFYMALFWIHTKLSVDPIRAGLFCAFTAVSKEPKRPCAALYDGAARGTLYFLMLGPYVVIPVIAFIVIYMRTKDARKAKV